MPLFMPLVPFLPVMLLSLVFHKDPQLFNIFINDICRSFYNLDHQRGDCKMCHSISNDDWELMQHDIDSAQKWWLNSCMKRTSRR
jgi:hypothetical protein